MARYLRSYGKAKYLNPLNLVGPSDVIFLPTPQVVLNAVRRSTQSSQLRPLSTKLRLPTVVNPKPNLFLPTLGSHINAVQRSRDAYKFRGKPQYTGTNPLYLIPPAFLPTVKTKLVSVENGLRDRRLFKNSTKLFPATVISPKPNLFLPNLGSHLIAISSTRDRYKFRGKPQYLGISYLLLRKPPFLPTLGKYLQAVPRALNQDQKKPYSTKLFPPTKINPKSFFLPTLGKYTIAVSRSLSAYQARQYSTKLRKPKVINPYIPVLPSFTPNYELPVDTLWYENPTYLQGAVDYDDPNTLYDANYPFDGAVTGNITSVYPQEGVLWDPEVYDGVDTLWSQNPNYLDGATLYDAAVLYDAVIPYDGTDNLVSVYPSSDTIWSGNSNE